MLNRVAKRIGPASPRAAWVVALAAIVSLLGAGGCSSSSPPAAGAAPPAPAQTLEPNVDESFSIRLDEDLFQLEEAISLIAASLNKVADRTPTMAINSFYFGKEVDADFRRKAEVIILDKLFLVNPKVRLVQCQECQKLETKIERGVLKLRKGIPSAESRRALAKKLGVDGFIDIGMFRTDGQLTVYLKVMEAESGAIIMVDELAGRRASRRRALTFSFGELIFPIKLDGVETDHRALALGVQESIKLTGRFSFAVDLVLFTDNNENSTDPTMVLDTGLLLAPTLGFDIIQVPSSTSRLIFFLGIGKLIDPQLDYANFFRTGLEMVVGDRLSVLFAFNSFLETNVELTQSFTSATLDGAGYDLRFGYRF